MAQVSNENEGNPTAANVDQDIPLGQPTMDERTIDAQQLTITNDNQSGVNSREYQLLYSIVQSRYAYDPDRNAEEEGRIAQLTEEDISFSSIIEVVENVQIMTDGHSVPQTAVVNPRYPINLPQLQNDIHSSDSSDGEEQIVSSESGFDGDDEDDSANEAMEVELNVGIPTDRTRQISVSLTNSTGIIPKSTNLVHPNIESSDEHKT